MIAMKNFELYKFDEKEVYYSYDHIIQIRDDEETRRLISKITKKEQSYFDKLGKILYDSLDEKDVCYGISSLQLDFFRKIGLGVIAIKYLGSGRIQIVSFGDIKAKFSYILNNVKCCYNVKSSWNESCTSKELCFKNSPQMNVIIQKSKVDIDFTGLI